MLSNYIEEVKGKGGAVYTGSLSDLEVEVGGSLGLKSLKLSWTMQ
jgi:hypothetical protein